MVIHYGLSALLWQSESIGGDNSKFTTNANDGAKPYSWREDTTMVLTFDSFYDSEPVSVKGKAIAWHQQTDKDQIGSDGLFSTKERRVL